MLHQSFASNIMHNDHKTGFVAPKSIIWQNGVITAPEVLLKNRGTFQTLWKKEHCTIPSGGSILLDYGCELQGGLRMVLGRCSLTGYTGERPYKVRVRLGESVSEAMNEPVNHHAIHDAEILLAPMGETCFGKSGFRFARIDNLDEVPLKFREISAAQIISTTPSIGTFVSSDTLLNTIFDCARRTINNCICDLIMDGAKRDRLVWMGDLYAELRAIHVLYGDHPAIRPTMEFMLDEAKETGIFNNIQPYSPYFFLALREYLRYTQSAEWVLSHRSNITNVADKMLTRWENDPDLLMTHGIIDWNEDSGLTPGGYPALLAWGVKSCTHLAKIFQDHTLLERCNKVYNNIAEMFKYSSDWRKSVAATAVLGGLADSQLVHKEILAAEPERWLSTFHMDNILQAWSAAGKGNEAIDLLKKYYGGMIQLGSSTYWEHFDLEYLNNASRIDELPVAGKRDVHKECGKGCFAGLRHSFCHGWGAAVAGWMIEELAGVKPAVDGFAKAAIAEKSAFAGELECQIPTPCGTIFIKRSKGVLCKLTTPESFSYDIV